MTSYSTSIRALENNSNPLQKLKYNLLQSRLEQKLENSISLDRVKLITLQRFVKCMDEEPKSLVNTIDQKNPVIEALKGAIEKEVLEVEWLDGDAQGLGDWVTKIRLSYLNEKAMLSLVYETLQIKCDLGKQASFPLSLFDDFFQYVNKELGFEDNFYDACIISSIQGQIQNEEGVISIAHI